MTRLSIIALSLAFATTAHARPATLSLDGFNQPLDATGTATSAVSTPSASPAASTDAAHSLFVAAPHTLSLPAGLEGQLNAMRAGAAAVVAAKAKH